jgi:hypothetical protein
MGTLRQPGKLSKSSGRLQSPTPGAVRKTEKEETEKLRASFLPAGFLTRPGGRMQSPGRGGILVSSYNLKREGSWCIKEGIVL